jgi:alpha/beta superfamily hydrolase
MLLSAAAAAGVGLTAYWTLLATRQERFVFDMHKAPPQDVDEGVSTYSHIVQGGMVRGLIAHPSGDEALTHILVYVPGRGEDVRVTARLASQLPKGRGFASLNYRGVADSDGRPSERSAVADFCQLCRHLRRAYPGVRLHLVGRSLGTGVAVQLAAKWDFASLQLITPYDRLIEVARRRFPLVPLDLLLRHQFASLEHCKTVAAKAQVLLAETDDVVEHARSHRLVRAWPQPIRVRHVAGTDHHSIVEVAETWCSLANFAWALAKPVRKAA